MFKNNNPADSFSNAKMANWLVKRLKSQSLWETKTRILSG